MTKSSDGIELTLFSKPQLLITESAEEFAALNAALMEEIRPRGTIERLYVDDIADHRLDLARGPLRKRASRNAYRHGLSLSLTSSAAIAKRLDDAGPQNRR